MSHMSDEKLDPTKTYVLEETAITRSTSLEDLAKAAEREISKARPRVGRTDALDLDSTQPQPAFNRANRD
jgi:hypothetical protein